MTGSDVISSNVTPTLLILKIIIGMSTERTTKCLVVVVENPLPVLLAYHDLLFDCTGNADPLIPIFSFK